MITVQYIKKEVEGVEKEEILLTMKDTRWDTITTDIYISLKDAHELVDKLSNKLSNIPY